jgi:hypothetical protein
MGATTGPYASPGPTSGPYSGSDDRISVTLTRREWHEIKAVLGEMWSGPQDVLWDQLERLERRHEPDVFGCDFYR